MRVFGNSGLVDRPSDCLYIHTITLYGCMDRHSCYTHFLLKNNWPIKVKHEGICLP